MQLNKEVSPAHELRQASRANPASITRTHETVAFPRDAIGVRRPTGEECRRGRKGELLFSASAVCSIRSRRRRACRSRVLLQAARGRRAVLVDGTVGAGGETRGGLALKTIGFGFSQRLDPGGEVAERGGEKREGAHGGAFARRGEADEGVDSPAAARMRVGNAEDEGRCVAGEGVAEEDGTSGGRGGGVGGVRAVGDW